jgi:fluoroquinolone transport system permease protein
MRTLAAFGRNDLVNIWRDSLLIYIVIVPWLMVLLLRLLIPSISAWFDNTYSIDLENYYPLILSFLVLQTPLMFGVIAGLLVLDERDEHTLMALRVTPLPLLGYMGYRIGMTMLVSVVTVVLVLPLTGLLPLAQLPAVLPSVVLASLIGPLLALVMVGFAGNKLEGLALMKGFGILLVGPLAAYFITSRWQLLLGLLPTYWPARAYWEVSSGGTGWPFLLVGLAYYALLLAWLLRRFQRRLDRVG